jgi:hypothetical protein
MTDKAINVICGNVWIAASLGLDGGVAIFAWFLGAAFLLLGFFHQQRADELPHRR